ncbi:MAG: fibronectin type III domain-containing protein [Armatimonadota bacterium]
MKSDPLGAGGAQPSSRACAGVGILCAVSALLSLGAMAPSRPAAAAPSDAAVRAAYERLPLTFEPNLGQTDPRVKFMARGPGYNLYLTGSEAVLSLPSAGERRGEVLRMQVEGARPAPRARGLSRLEGKVNYFRGADRSKWLRNVSTYGRVQFDEVYPGIDLVYYGAQSELEYDFVVKPGADPEAVKLRFSGAKRLEVDAKGDLLLHTTSGPVRQHRPVVYQEVDGRRRLVPARYELLAGNRVKFALGSYDRARTLVIDPVLTYSSYLGGWYADAGYAIATDGNGAAIVAGQTSSWDFPLQNPIQEFQSSFVEAFVTRFNTSGSTIVYSTFIGGSEDDRATGVAIDGTGAVYVAGRTASEDFPELNGVQQTYGGGGSDAFVVKLAPSGSAIVYSTYVGGSDTDGSSGVALAVTGSGEAVIGGETRSSDFPKTNARGFGGGVFDGFLTKLSADGQSFVFSTYLGGSSYDAVQAVAVDGAGAVYAAGGTESSNFPVLGSLHAHAGGSDAFVTKLSANGSTQAYGTFLGGTNDETAYGLAVDGSGAAYVVGKTTSTNFPTSTAYDATLGGSQDAFLVKLNASGGGRVYSTYLGGSNRETAHAVAVDGSGAAYVVGATESADFPIQSPSQRVYGGGTGPEGDGFVTKFRAAGTSLHYSTFVGGSESDAAYGVAVHGSVASVTGRTASPDFPLASARQPILNGEDGSDETDAFLVRLTSSGTSAPAAPGSLNGTVVSTSRVDLSWADASNNEDGFEIERKVQGGVYSVIGQSAKDTTTFTDSTVAENVTYVYRVRAVNDFDYSGYSPEKTIQVVVQGAPNAPSGLVATPVSSSRIDLRWIDNSDNEIRFEVERKSEGGGYAVIGTTNPGVVAFSDTNASSGVTYTYRVRAIGVSGNSGYSTEVSVSTPNEGAPNAPGTLQASAVSSTRVNLTWQDLSSDETGFKIERRTASTAYTQIGTAAAGATSYSDTTANAGTTYTYRVRATNGNGDSLYSNEATATTSGSGGGDRPAVPTGISATALSSRRVQVSWTDASNNETGFKIERKSGTGDFAEVGTAAANATSFLDQTVQPGTQYTYRVRSANAAGSSDPSGEATVTTPSQSGKLLAPKQRTLDFGTLKPGKTKTKPIKLKNIGSGPLYVEIPAPAAPYTATPVGGVVIAAKQTLTVNVQFAPTAKGSFKSSLTVTTDENGGRSVKFNLKGKRK